METSLSLLEQLRHSTPSVAWQRFVELYAPLIYHWLRRAGLPEDDTADLVQEVLLVMVKKLPDFQHNEHGSFRAWLRTVTINQSRDFFRQQASRADREKALARLESNGESEADLLSQQEYRQHLARRALTLMQTEFQPATWRACWESVVNERPAQEIADELGISVNSVYLAKSRVLRRLRHELDGLWD